MKTREELARMTRDDCAAACAELVQEQGKIISSKHRLSAADEQRVRELQDEFDQVNGHRKRLDVKSGREPLGEGRTKLVPGTDPGDGDHERGSRVPGRDRAMRLLERAVSDGTVNASGAETVERQLDTGSLLARSWSARWVAATGSEAYRSAFAKKAIDPDNGHLSWTPDEAEAWRVATAVHAERSAMSLTDNQGGYLVPWHLDPTVLLTNGGSTNPLLQIARVEPTFTDVWHGVTSAGVTAEWLGEGDEAADASPTFGQPAIPCHKASAYVEWSFEVGMDAASFLDELGKLLLDGLDQLTSAASTLGTGTGQPTGVVTAVAAAGGSVVSPTVAETFSAADIYKVQNEAAPRWQANSSWMMGLGLINTARQFETGNGALRFPELRDNPPMLLGRNVFENSHMDVTINPAVTEDNFVALYGDFKQFLITVRSGSLLELIPNVVGPNRRPVGRRGGFLWARYGSGVLVPEAFRLLSIPTTA
ncbi:phage major capsid protein [Mycobacterium sp. SMC-4]|uniref:phage major capsid protein n=1 Tax=Mycobacterium sp. SMC-4 TaxID=2857059 RepID=UPI0021B2D06A|nr:phage major capsid protein [Mycobacterium sp. SMC-4]UXA16971.1 phage major capsid protein [Mycobacterium sp. SMC-4]